MHGGDVCVSEQQRFFQVVLGLWFFKQILSVLLLYDFDLNCKDDLECQRNWRSYFYSSSLF